MCSMGEIGFMRSGIMGQPMVKNLAKGGHKLVVYDINAAMGLFYEKLNGVSLDA